MESLLKVYVNKCDSIPAKQLEKLNDDMLFSYLRKIDNNDVFHGEYTDFLRGFFRMNHHRQVSFINNKFYKIIELEHFDYLFNNLRLKEIIFFIEKLLIKKNYKIENFQYKFVLNNIKYLSDESIKKIIDENLDVFSDKIDSIYHYFTGIDYIIKNIIIEHFFKTIIDKINTDKNSKIFFYFLSNVDFFNKKLLVDYIIHNLVNDENIKIVNENVTVILLSRINKLYYKKIISDGGLEAILNSDKFIFTEKSYPLLKNVLNDLGANLGAILEKLIKDNRLDLPKK